MPHIKPFKAVVYNQDKIGDLAKVATPPYDVISAEKQKYFLKKHPHNIAHIILNPIQDSDNEKDNRYSRAKKLLDEWIQDEILVQDEKDAIYLYEQHFKVHGKLKVRRGFIAAGRIEDGGGDIKPHENTLDKPKADRVKMLTATRMNLEPIFLLYDDPEGVLKELYAGVAGKAPIIDMKDDAGERHLVWEVTDPSLIKELQKSLENKRLFIADGHHRYEASRIYRDSLGAFGEHPAAYRMMYFTALEDAGLVVLPIHRLINHMHNFAPQEIIERAKEYFSVLKLKVDKNFFDKLEESGSNIPSFGIYFGGKDIYLLTLQNSKALDVLVGKNNPPVWKELDVVIVHTLIIQKVLGITEEDLRQESNITYCHDNDDALREVKEGKYQMAILLNGTRVSQIAAVANAGFKMPQKSTFFYPKLLTGLVMRSLED